MSERIDRPRRPSPIRFASGPRGRNTSINNPGARTMSNPIYQNRAASGTSSNSHAPQNVVPSFPGAGLPSPSPLPAAQTGGGPLANLDDHTRRVYHHRPYTTTSTTPRLGDARSLPGAPLFEGYYGYTPGIGYSWGALAAASGGENAGHGQGTAHGTDNDTGAGAQSSSAGTLQAGGISGGSSNPIETTSRGIAIDFSIPQPVVTISVGQGSEQQTFIIHKIALTLQSPFFKRAFENEFFIEGRSQCMAIDDVDGAVFGLLVNWIYLTSFKGSGIIGAPSMLLLGKLWALADRFLMPHLQNAVVDEMYRSRAKLTDIVEFSYALNYIYNDDEDTDEEGKQHPLRQLLVDKFAYERVNNWKEKTQELPKQFLLDLVENLVNFCTEVPPVDYAQVFDPKSWHVPVNIGEDA